MTAILIGAPSQAHTGTALVATRTRQGAYAGQEHRALGCEWQPRVIEFFVRTGPEKNRYSLSDPDSHNNI